MQHKSRVTWYAAGKALASRMEPVMSTAQWYHGPLKLNGGLRGPRVELLETAVMKSVNLPETAVGTHRRFGFLPHSPGLWDSCKCPLEGPFGPCSFNLYTGWLPERPSHGLDDAVS